MTSAGTSSVSRETRERLEVFVAELARWQGVKNLVGPRTMAEVWTRHVADSLQLLDLAPAARSWIDLGSGAGFPGLVVAIAASERPGFTMTLIESDGRKCAFLREAARRAGATVRVVDARIEAALPELPVPEIVSARALAALDVLLGWCAPVLAAGAVGLFPKGRDVASELTQARRRWTFETDLIQSRTDDAARIVRVHSFSGPAT